MAAVALGVVSAVSGLFGMSSANRARRAAKAANAWRVKLMALRNARERRQLIRQSYIARSQVAAQAGAMEDGGLGSSAVQGSIFSTLQQTLNENQFLNESARLEQNVARNGGYADAYNSQVGIFSGLSNVLQDVGRLVPSPATTNPTVFGNIPTNIIDSNPNPGESTGGYA